MQAVFMINKSEKYTGNRIPHKRPSPHSNVVWRRTIHPTWFSLPFSI